LREARPWKRCCERIGEAAGAGHRAGGGKAGKPNEFGKMAKLQEAENQIVIDYEVYDTPIDV
jgi:hypothetical protein